MANKYIPINSNNVSLFGDSENRGNNYLKIRDMLFELFL
jgi:hypothetical protein